MDTENTALSPAPSDKPKLAASIYDWVETFCYAMALMVVLFLLVCRYVTVDGDSMRETLHDSDKLIISGLGYTPETGDIVVVKVPAYQNPIIKRVIATEGQEVEIDFENWTVKVDGVLLEEDSIQPRRKLRRRQRRPLRLDGLADRRARAALHRRAGQAVRDGRQPQPLDRQPLLDRRAGGRAAGARPRAAPPVSVQRVRYGRMNGPIVWFPGHMAKARRQLQSSLSEVDAVIEILDARLPLSSRNPDFVSLFGAKPCLTLLNKSALADEKREQSFIHKLEREGRRVLAVDCKAYRNIARVTPALRGLVEEKLARDAAKGLTRPLRVMVVGITNVGKSTFINTYTKTKKAKAEDRPGVTREQRWIASPYGVELLDTPGLLWHKFDDPAVGIKLACTGAIRDEILDLYSLSHELLGMLAQSYPALLEARYGIKIAAGDSIGDVFEAIARRRGFLRAGGEIDEERTAAVLLDEFRGGRIGRITLD